MKKKLPTTILKTVKDKYNVFWGTYKSYMPCTSNKYGKKIFKDAQLAE